MAWPTPRRACRSVRCGVGWVEGEGHRRRQRDGRKREVGRGRTGMGPRAARARSLVREHSSRFPLPSSRNGRPSFSRMETNAYPAETVEGWYALHQMLQVDRAALRALGPERLANAVRSAAVTLDALATPEEAGWSAVVPLVGSPADVMLVHLRPTLDALAAIQSRLGCLTLFDALKPVYSFLSITEVGMYHVAARAA